MEKLLKIIGIIQSICAIVLFIFCATEPCLISFIGIFTVTAVFIGSRVLEECIEDRMWD